MSEYLHLEENTFENLKNVIIDAKNTENKEVIFILNNSKLMYFRE